MMYVRAAVARQPGLHLSLEHVELDQLRPDEILVRMVATGICHTDISAAQQRIPVQFPIILGHEGAGIVEQIGEQVKTVSKGDKVLLLPDYCGYCDRCKRGQTTYCQNMTEVAFSGEREGDPRARLGSQPVRAAFFGQSSFSTYSLVTERNVFKVDETAPLLLYAALTCGIQTGAGAVFNALSVPVGASITIFGTGGVGLAALMAAVNAGASKIIAVDRVTSRLKLAEELGATATIDTRKTTDLVGQIRAYTGEGSDYTLDTTGSADLIRAAIESLAIRGTCGILTGTGLEVTLPIAAILNGGRTVRGIIGGDSSAGLTVKKLIHLYEQGRFPFDRLVRHFPFEEINQAIEEMLSGRVIKPVLTFASSLI